MGMGTSRRHSCKANLVQFPDEEQPPTKFCSWHSRPSAASLAEISPNPFGLYRVRGKCALQYRCSTVQPNEQRRLTTQETGTRCLVPLGCRKKSALTHTA